MPHLITGDTVPPSSAVPEELQYQDQLSFNGVCCDFKAFLIIASVKYVFVSVKIKKEWNLFSLSDL